MMLCHPDNQQDFREALKSLMPEAHELALALYRAGLIDGLRGMALAPTPPGLPWPAGVSPVLSLASEIRLTDAAWRREQQA